MDVSTGFKIFKPDAPQEIKIETIILAIDNLMEGMNDPQAREELYTVNKAKLQCAIEFQVLYGDLLTDILGSKNEEVSGKARETRETLSHKSSSKKDPEEKGKRSDSVRWSENDRKSSAATRSFGSGSIMSFPQFRAERSSGGGFSTYTSQPKDGHHSGSGTTISSSYYKGGHSSGSRSIPSSPRSHNTYTTSSHYPLNSQAPPSAIPLPLRFQNPRHPAHRNLDPVPDSDSNSNSDSDTDSLYKSDPSFPHDRPEIIKVLIPAKDKQRPCHICTDEMPSKHISKLPCGHYLCLRCVRRKFSRSIHEESQYPPRCCSIIPLSTISSLLSKEIIIQFLEKSYEWETIERVYCSNSQCGAFIKPNGVAGGRRTCRSCGVVTCGRCKRAGHGGKCVEVRDGRATKVRERSLARVCFNCHFMPLRVEGCTHVVCPCGARWCATCGVPWAKEKPACQCH